MEEDVRIRAVAHDYPVTRSTSEFDDWGEMSPEARGMEISRWLIEVATDGQWREVGNLSAQAVRYGPTPASQAMNIGISIIKEFRDKGYGSIAQRLLAEEFHEKGFVRVEASTDILNIAEQKALKKAGFTYEGTLRKAQGRADGLHDLQIWSHLS
jgi:RimJ/RimL family protein N-acetyltransferase